MSASTSSPARLHLRPGQPSDAEDCSRVFWDAFESIATRHSFPIEPETPEFCSFMSGIMLSHPGYACTVAEQDGAMAGCIFVDRRSTIIGIGPVAVAPEFQDAGVGRALMEHVLADEAVRNAPGVRLVQTAYHYRSLSLYAKLGFRVRETLSVLRGEVEDDSPMPGTVRAATMDDLPACNQLSLRVHGHDRGGELSDSIFQGTASVIERDGRLTGYAPGIGYGSHAVGETDEDIVSLIRAAPAIFGLGFFVPSRNAPLLGWCLDHGLRIVQQSTLMTMGLYNEPQGSYLPSIIF